MGLAGPVFQVAARSLGDHGRATRPGWHASAVTGGSRRRCGGNRTGNQPPHVCYASTPTSRDEPDPARAVERHVPTVPARGTGAPPRLRGPERRRPRRRRGRRRRRRYGVPPGGHLGVSLHGRRRTHDGQVLGHVGARARRRPAAGRGSPSAAAAARPGRADDRPAARSRQVQCTAHGATSHGATPHGTDTGGGTAAPPIETSRSPLPGTSTRRSCSHTPETARDPATPAPRPRRVAAHLQVVMGRYHTAGGGRSARGCGRGQGPRRARSGRARTAAAAHRVYVRDHRSWSRWS